MFGLTGCRVAMQALICSKQQWSLSSATVLLLLRAWSSPLGLPPPSARQISGNCEIRRSGCSQQPDCQHEPMAAETVGTTAVVLAVTAAHLVVANAGDSRAVLARAGQAVPLSKDHKVDGVGWGSHSRGV